MTGDLADATIMELDTEGTYDTDKQTGFDATSGTLYLYFKNATTIEAGKPYIVKWTTGSNVTNPTFTGVSVTSTTPTTINSEDTKVSFKGMYSPVTLPANDKSNLFLGSGNQLHWSTADVTLNAFRCYFQLNSATQVKDFVLNFGEGEPTLISLPKGREASDDAWFDLSGRKLQGKPIVKGMYIHGNRKVVVK